MEGIGLGISEEFIMPLEKPTISLNILVTFMDVQLLSLLGLGIAVIIAFLSTCAEVLLHCAAPVESESAQSELLLASTHH
jgi:hypothetical protein